MPSSKNHRVIAVEEHFSTDALLDRASSMPVFPGEETDHDLVANYWTNEPLRRRLTDRDAWIAAMDETGVDLSVLSVAPPGAQACASAGDATALARDANDVLADIVRRRPDRFAGLGALAPQEPERAADEIKRAMGALKLGGFMIYSHTGGRYLDDPACEPILAALEEEDATLYLHPRVPSPGMIEPFRPYGMLGAVWGFQAEVGTHAVRLILSGVFDRHPKLRVVLGHLGEGIPFWLGRLDSRVDELQGVAGEKLGMPKLQMKPSKYFTRNFWVTTSGMSFDAPLAFCLDQLGAEKIMFAIDYPFEKSKEATDFLRDAPLTEDQRAHVSHRNAEQVFRVAPGDDHGETAANSTASG